MVTNINFKKQKDMEQNQPLYDMNHPFYYDPHPESKMGEGNDKSIEEAVKQLIYYVVLLVVMFVTVSVICGVLHFMKIC